MRSTQILATENSIEHVVAIPKQSKTITVTWKIMPKFKGTFQIFVSYDAQQSFSHLDTINLNGQDAQYGFMSYQLNHVSDGDTFVKVPIIENHDSPSYQILEYIKVSY